MRGPGLHPAAAHHFLLGTALHHFLCRPHWLTSLGWANQGSQLRLHAEGRDGEFEDDDPAGGDINDEPQGPETDDEPCLGSTTADDQEAAWGSGCSSGMDSGIADKEGLAEQAGSFLPYAESERNREAAGEAEKELRELQARTGRAPDGLKSDCVVIVADGVTQWLRPVRSVR